MVMNLQFFGGRGSESGIGGSKLKQITVNMGANSITYRNEGRKTYRVGQGNTVGENGTVDKSLNEIKQAAEKAGYQVKTYTGKEYKDYQKKYKEQREKDSKQLDTLWFKGGPRPKKGMKGH